MRYADQALPARVVQRLLTARSDRLCRWLGSARADPSSLRGAAPDPAYGGGCRAGRGGRGRGLHAYGDRPSPEAGATASRGPRAWTRTWRWPRPCSPTSRPCWTGSTARRTAPGPGDAGLARRRTRPTSTCSRTPCPTTRASRRRRRPSASPSVSPSVAASPSTPRVPARAPSRWPPGPRRGPARAGRPAQRVLRAERRVRPGAREHGRGRRAAGRHPGRRAAVRR